MYLLHSAALKGLNKLLMGPFLFWVEVFQAALLTEIFLQSTVNFSFIFSPDENE